MIFCQMEAEQADALGRRLAAVCQQLMPACQIIDFYRLAHGHRHDNYLLTSDQGLFLLQIKGPDERLEVQDPEVDSDLEEAIYAHLGQAIDHPRCLVRASVGTEEFVLYSYREGRELDEALALADVDKREKIFYRLGQELAQIHESKNYSKSGHLDKDLSVCSTFSYLKVLDEMLADKRLTGHLGPERMEDILGLTHLYRPLLARLEKKEDFVFLHGDLARENIILAQDDFIFLDWESCLAGLAHFDIGQLFRGLASEEGVIRSFFQGYDRRAPGRLGKDWWPAAKFSDLVDLLYSRLWEREAVCQALAIEAEIDRSIGLLKGLSPTIYSQTKQAKQATGPVSQDEDKYKDKDKGVDHD